MILGLTGGIATGKSTVTGMLRERGIPVIDADQIAREVVEPGKPAYEAIVRHFGRDILLEDGQIDRKGLGEIVFSDESERQKLNAIVHPEVRRVMREEAEAAEANGADIVFMDIPLLFESKLQHMVEKIVVVYAPYDMQLARMIERDELEEEQAKKRLRAQFPIEQKKLEADFLIDNSFSREETERQVESASRRNQVGAALMRPGKRAAFILLVLMSVFAARYAFGLEMDVPHQVSAGNRDSSDQIQCRPLSDFGRHPFRERLQNRPRLEKGAVGLMQIMPDTAEWIVSQAKFRPQDEQYLYDPVMNIEIGTWYLNFLLNRYEGDLIKVIAAYNAGPGKVNGWLESQQWSGHRETIEDIPFGETRQYVQRVLYYHDRYKRIYDFQLR